MEKAIGVVMEEAARWAVWHRGVTSVESGVAEIFVLSDRLLEILAEYRKVIANHPDPQLDKRRSHRPGKGRAESRYLDQVEKLRPQPGDKPLM